MTKLSLQNPLLTNEQIESTPSSHHGISKELENALRIFGCDLIQSVGCLLKLPQVAMATAQALFQRFYYLESFKLYPLRDIAMGALFLASKVEECTPRAREIVVAFDWMVKKARTDKPEPISLFGSEFFEMRSAMVNGEMYILRTLGFNVHVQHAHGVMVNYLQSLRLTSDTAICQRAWNYLNDGVRTTTYFAYPVHVLACAAIYIAARDTGVPLPEAAGSEWYKVFETDLEDIEIIVRDWKALYAFRFSRKLLPFTLKETVDYLEKHNGNLF